MVFELSPQCLAKSSHPPHFQALRKSLEATGGLKVPPPPPRSLLDGACSPWICVTADGHRKLVGRSMKKKEEEGERKTNKQTTKGGGNFKNKGSDEPGLNPGAASHRLGKLR